MGVGGRQGIERDSGSGSESTVGVRRGLDQRRHRRATSTQRLHVDRLSTDTLHEPFDLLQSPRRRRCAVRGVHTPPGHS